MATRRADPVGRDGEPLGELIRRELAKPAELPWKDGLWTPLLMGPTWRIRENGHWDLPEYSLGWDAFDWIGDWLELAPGKPWVPTPEQARFLLWWYAFNGDSGRFTFRDGVLQRLKGWGKDPLGAVIIALEALGPCRVQRDDVGSWRGVDNPQAWVQTAAVSLEQTKNTMRVFPSLLSKRAQAAHGIQIGKTIIHALGDTRLIEAVTSSPATLEGARSTFVLLNETQHWDSSNEGHEMADVIERNATKSPDGAARTLAITNAYEPSQDSVAQRTREAYDEAEAGGTLMTGLLYDSVEADPRAPLSAEHAPEVVESIRGDSWWINTERVVESILDLRNSASRSRRWWYNQVVASEDAWTTPREWDAIACSDLEPEAGTVITLGFDGSSAHDHSALVGVEVATNHAFLIAAWKPPPRGEIDRRQVDLIVRKTIEHYDVVGFYSDVREFESYVDSWGQEFGEGYERPLLVNGTPKNPVAWDMRNRERLFTVAAEALNAAIAEGAKTAAKGEVPGFTHDGTPEFAWYVKNARQNPNKYGISIRKESRNSSKKIDALAAAVLAWIARTDYLALPEEKRRRKKRTGRVW